MAIFLFADHSAFLTHRKFNTFVNGETHNPDEQEILEEPAGIKVYRPWSFNYMTIIQIMDFYIKYKRRIFTLRVGSFMLIFV